MSTEEESGATCKIEDKDDTACTCQSCPSSFTISEKALEKIKHKRSTSEFAAREAIIEALEEKWINREKCLEDAHSRKWGYSKAHLDEMEERLLKVFDLLPPCPSEAEAVKCYKIAKKKIDCACNVADYVTCIENFTKKIIARTGAVSHVKERPTTKLK